MDDLEAIKKLDEAIQALKEAGYEFTTIKFSKKIYFTAETNMSRKTIQIYCDKELPESEPEEVTAIRNLLNFSRS